MWHLTVTFCFGVSLVSVVLVSNKKKSAGLPVLPIV